MNIHDPTYSQHDNLHAAFRRQLGTIMQVPANIQLPHLTVTTSLPNFQLVAMNFVRAMTFRVS
jgi:hypothetical protein